MEVEAPDQKPITHAHHYTAPPEGIRRDEADATNSGNLIASIENCELHGSLRAERSRCIAKYLRRMRWSVRLLRSLSTSGGRKRIHRKITQMTEPISQR